MLKKTFQLKLETILLDQIRTKESTIKLISCAVEAVLTYGSVFQKRLALPFSNGKRIIESSLRSVERFFENSKININDFFHMIGKELNIKGKVILTMDRTTWCYGQKPINLLVIAVVYNNSAVPIIWEALAKKGSSNTSERKRIIKKLLSVIGINKIEAILADREFIGWEWFQFLYKLNFPFIIRIKNNSYVTLKNGEKAQVSRLMKDVKRNEQKEIYAIINNIQIRLVATRSTEGELVVVAASQNISGNVLDDYKKRWLIELCFKSLKSKGFNIEETHITDPERINKLFAIIAIACLLVVKVGVLRKLFKKIPVKSHGRPLYSVFTYGLDFIKIIFSDYFSHGESPPIYKEVINLLFSGNCKKDCNLRIKNVGY